MTITKRSGPDPLTESVLCDLYEVTKGKPFSASWLARAGLADVPAGACNVVTRMAGDKPTAARVGRWLKSNMWREFNGWGINRGAVSGRYETPKGICEGYVVPRIGGECNQRWQIDREYEPEQYAKEQAELRAALHDDW